MAEAKQQNTQPERHPWSFQIARVAGIPIRLHFTFLLFLVYIGSQGHGAERPLRVVILLAAFLCVALHELGHSLVALRYGIPVADITLYPIGGLARIEKRPTPKQEFWIAIAGPLVNFVIALLLWGILGFRTSFPVPDPAAHGTAAVQNVLVSVLGINVMLFLFNLIPAFPMDGGRILRSLLAAYMPVERATAVAAGIGQMLAIVLGFFAMFAGGSVFLLFIALFVFIGAGQEATATQQEAVLQGITVGQAMMTEVRTLPMNATLKEAADVLLATSQHDFPVMLGESVQGLLTRNGLLRGLAHEGPGAYVAGIMDRAFLAATPEDDLGTLLQRMQDSTQPVLVIEGGDRLRGMVTGDNVAEFYAVRQIFKSRDQAGSTSGGALR